MTLRQVSDEVVHVSTGSLPPRERVQSLVDEAYERFRSDGQGRVSDAHPALARVPASLFGICVASTDGDTYAVSATPHTSSRS